MDWNTPIRNIAMVGPIYANRLAKLEIYTAGDLLLHIPSRYADFSQIVPIAKLHEEDTVTVVGTIESSKNQYLRGGRQIQSATLSDGTGTVSLTWFNQPFIVRAMPSGTRVSISGKVSRFGTRFEFTAPEYEAVKEGKPHLHTGRLVPVYPETAGVSSKWLRSRIAPLLATPLVDEFLPTEIILRQHLPPLPQSLNTIHFPKSLAQVETGRHRLAFDELFLLQTRAVFFRKLWQREKLTESFTINHTQIQKLLSSLPFNLTSAQKRALGEILVDLSQPHPMNRLLQGDVGSGKTVVAAIAMYVAYINGFQSLLMAPTEILAEQHFQTLTNILAPFGLKITLRTGSHKDTTMPQTSVLVGTHALLLKQVSLPRIRLVVIDEQHRFGVTQRAILRQKGQHPHVLTMTATPIPRTVALTLYGDLDLSVIDELPTGRKPVKTWVVPPEKRTAAYRWMRAQIQSGSQHQAFIICPFIEISESLQSVKAATEEYAYLQKEVFFDLKLGLLHGKLSAKVKELTLGKFRRGKLDILVATPVVEVGIDIPTASIILIEAAERFGLAQLHQLRGRVGRADVQSYCLLFTSSTQITSTQRLKYMEKLNTGARLAEVDLRLRGPGQIYGTLQHGQSPLKIASFADTVLIASAKREAETLMSGNPNLTGYPNLKDRCKSDTITAVTPD